MASYVYVRDLMYMRLEHRLNTPWRWGACAHTRAHTHGEGEEEDKKEGSEDQTNYQCHGIDP